MTMRFDELPRRAVHGYLGLVRMPVSVAERALGKTDGTWPVTIAADRVQATIKSVAGALLRDDTLRADAQLQRAALDERVRALDAEDHADRLREEQVAVEARGEQRDRLAERHVEAKRRTSRKVAAAKEQAIDRRARTERSVELGAEARAVRERRAAAEAKAEVLELDDELQRTRAARKGD